jgi:5'-3' exonuclease
MKNLSESEFVILIDMSYFIFYRYFALIHWWKLAKPEEELVDPFMNQDFVDKFIKTFHEKINEIPKKLKLKNYTILAAKDTQRNLIWRNELFKQYKEQRILDDEFMGGPFFEIAYNKLLNNICKAIKEKYPDKKIIIIANDMDYLQIADESISIINLKYKNLQDSKNSTKNKDCDLFCKIILGDKSDNIPGIFKKCGPKTALKYFEDKELFEKALEKEKAHKQFEFNKKIISFTEIPIDLQEAFALKYPI